MIDDNQTQGTQMSNGQVDTSASEEANGQLDQMKEEVLKRSKEVLKRLPALGPIMLLYLQSDHRKFIFISDIEWLVLPPLMAGQCKLYMNQDHPVSYVSWAFLNKDAEGHLLKNAGKLRPDEWNCGDRLWLMDIVAPLGGIEEMMTDLRENQFPSQTLRMLVPDVETGGVMVRKLKAEQPEPKDDTE